MIFCQRKECLESATCAVGLALFPHPAVRVFNKSDAPITRLILGFYLCDAHMAVAVEEGPFELVPRDKMEAIADFCRRTAFTVVDLDATKVVRVELNDEELAMLQKSGGEGEV